MLNNILVPLDGSVWAETALQVAQKIAKNTTSLVLVNAIEESFLELEIGHEAEKQQVTEKSKYLQSVLVKLSTVSTKLAAQIRRGSAAAVILQTAKEKKADLIVMTRHTHSYWSKSIFGSVTKRVLRNSECPVLVLRDHIEVTRILVPLDQSYRAEAILPLVKALAQRTQAEIVLAHVSREPSLFESIAKKDDANNDLAVTGRLRAGTEQVYLQRIAKKYGVEGNVKYVCMTGPTALTIASIADELDCDIIAMSTHGEGGDMRWRFGHVTEHVMRLSDKSFLIARPQLVATVKDGAVIWQTTRVNYPLAAVGVDHSYGI